MKEIEYNYNKISDLTISKLITSLESLKNKYGDLPLWIMTVNDYEKKELKELTTLSVLQKDDFFVVCLVSENPESFIFQRTR